MARHRNHHKRRLTNVPAGINRPTAVFSRMCPEASSTSDPVEPADPDGPNETVEDPGRRSDENYPRMRNGHTTRGQSSRPGTTSMGRLMSTTISTSPGWWAFDELLVFRDVSALPTNSRTLPDIGGQTGFANFGRHTDGYNSYNFQQRPKHVWGAAPPWQHADGVFFMTSDIDDAR